MGHLGTLLPSPTSNTSRHSDSAQHALTPPNERIVITIPLATGEHRSAVEQHWKDKQDKQVIKLCFLLSCMAIHFRHILFEYN